MGVLTYHVYCRVVGNTIGLALHVGNSIAMFFALQGDVLKDPEIRTLKSMQFAFITIWNVCFQMFFLLMSLISDVSLILKVKEEHKCIQYVRRYRKVFFAGVVWPTSVMIFTIFWPVFYYDRELIFPKFIDKALSLTSNHIMHSSILPIVLLELFFQPRSKPNSHGWYILHTVAVYVSYVSVVFSIYAQRGIWPYPFLKMTYGTIYFPLVFLAIAVSYMLVYYLQWPLTEIIFENCIKMQKIN